MAINLDPETGTFELYLNGNLIANTQYENPEIPWIDESIECGPSTDYVISVLAYNEDINSLYNGNIDELRVWQRFRPAEEIKQNYTRNLVGNEDGLIVYCNMDEGFGSTCYDLSKQNGEFNKNNYYIPSFIPDSVVQFPEWSSETPSFEQLHPSGITDANGNYIVKSIRYNGGGNIFNVTPILGVHYFNPTDINLYIGDNLPIHNNINFVDESTFRFTGTVYYQNTNFPVKGASVSIDNQQLFDAGGNPVLTNEYGQIDIDVPIGSHYIRVHKNNHTFVNNGQWPAPSGNNLYPTFNFQDDVYNITFFDNTTVTLCGRFVGGDVEGEKKIGFNKSKNNIGIGTIVFENEQGYDISYNSPQTDTSFVSVNTHPESGEYEIQLLPEVYKIYSVGNSHYAMDPNDLGLLDLRSIPEISIENDTIYNEIVVGNDTIIEWELAEYPYHVLRNFIIYVSPQIEVLGDNNEALIGEREIVIFNPISEENDTIDLTNNSPFNYPIFEMGKAYDISISLHANYYNYDGGDTVEDRVPIENAQILVTNNLEINQPSYELQTNGNGTVDNYLWFRVGVPNMTESDEESFTKTMSIVALHDDYNVQWEGNQGDHFRAYVLGGVDYGGVNFVTYGPEIPEYILRDPPGSNSYTYLEEESGYTVSQKFSFSFGGGSEYDNKLLYGCKFEVGGGLLGPIFTAEHKNTLNGGIKATSFVNESGELTESVQFMQRFSTSSEPTAVGSMADVYIGKSYNMFFTQTLNLRILPTTYCIDNGLEHLDETYTNGAYYTLGKREGFAVTEDSSSTYFIYSQDHILNSLLPNYRQMIYTLLETSPNYQSKIPATHLYYGTSNDAPAWADTIAITGDTLPSYEFLGELGDIDSIAMMNQQIAIWLQTIALNEQAKINAQELVENISIDGNAGAYENVVSYTSTSKEATTYNYMFKLFGGAEMGFEFNKFGFQIISKTYKNWERELEYESTTERSMTFGYVIDDSDMSDYYSFDVKMDQNGVMESNVDNFINEDNKDDFADFNQGMMIASGVSSGIGLVYSKLLSPAVAQIFNIASTVGIASLYLAEMQNYRDDIEDEADEGALQYGLCASSPVFLIQGGRSSCPYEGPEYTFLHLNPNNNQPYVIHQGTQQREGPEINISPASIVNVPDGESAIFELELTNNSLTGHDFIYQLKVDETANPNGAILKIDGIDPNRPFFVPAGTTINKTLTVEQNPSGDMEYENLGLIFHSSCQYDPTDNFPDIADSVYFSAYFIPTCTNVSFGNITQNWVLNTYNHDTLPVNITGYNINHSTFEKIIFQYQQSGSTPTTAMTCYKDFDDFNEATESNKIFIDGASEINFNWSASALNDGDFTLILKSVCSDGSITEADHLQGIIDRITPKPFGNPQPADGVLSAGENISIKFNEEINAGNLYAHADYMEVRGIINGTDLVYSPLILHDASIHFDGEDDYVAVNNGINLDHSSWTMEFWAKRMGTGRECLVSLGDPNAGGLWIGFNESDHFVVQADGQIVVSDYAYNNLDVWNHYAISFQLGNGTVSPGITAIIASDSNTEEKYQTFNLYTTLENAFYIGYCPQDNSAFEGNIHEFRIWNYYRTINDVNAQRYILLNGYEQGLYAFWPMNEAKGNIANDMASGKNAQVNATWSVSRDSKSIVFDGNSQLEMPTGSMVFDTQTDFTIEFWFKTPMPTTEECILSNGKGTTELNPNAWTIITTPDANIRINNNSNSIVVPANNYLDNNWHHMALTVNRLGYVSVVMDGELVSTTPSGNFKGFANHKLVLGARNWDFEMTEFSDMPFTGVIDELRIWNCYRGIEQIQRYMNHSLSGTEYGLKAYFPFEDVTIADPSISNESLLNFTTDTIGNAGDASFVANTSFDSESPNIKLQRPEFVLPFTYVINTDEVIITPNMEMADIENCILDISIRKVKDMNGNEMSSTVTWSAFIDQNQVVWDMQELYVEKYLDETYQLSVQITNQGGNNENFQITNIPSWLNISPETGNLSPLETETITIEVLPQLNVGSYTHDINLVASMGYNERLNINVLVKAYSPDWEVNPIDYEYSASIIGQLKINDIISTDVNDIIGCFSGNQCRGVANLQYFEAAGYYLLFMDIYSNQSSGENIQFKVFDASTGNIYTDVIPELIFETNQLYGSVLNPISIEASNQITQTINLNTGWNWLSFNVASEAMSNINLLLNDLVNHNQDLFRTQDLISQYSESLSMWVGNLTSCNYIDMFKFKTGATQNLELNGDMLISDTIDIPLVSGWNWIGYPSQINATTQTALGSLNPNTGDLVKSQTGFAIYDEYLGWVGSLQYFMPGKGYMFFSQQADTIVFPASVSKNSPLITPRESQFNDNIHLTPDNMTMIAITDLEFPKNYELIAYDENGIAGSAYPIKVNEQWLYFITLNSYEGNNITFRGINQFMSLTANESINFSENNQKGELNNPFILTFNNNNDIAKSSLIEIYPNPFDASLYIDLQLNETSSITISLFNVLGELISAKDNISLNNEIHTLSLHELLNTYDLPKGVYYLKLSGIESEVYKKIVKQ
jgi:hypothetical protein